VQRILKVSSLQLLVAPFSSVHEDETHQWRGYDGKNKEDLMAFIKSTSRGHSFKFSYVVQQTQIVRAFHSFLGCASPDCKITEADALNADIHDWDDYFRIDVGRYFGEIELIRDLKQRAIEGLVDLFPSWRTLQSTFEEDLSLEFGASAKEYLESYFRYAARIATGDYAALLDAPMVAGLVESLMFCFNDDVPHVDRIRRIKEFLRSPHFYEVPYELISARIFATLKDMVKRGAYADRDNALKRLRGFFHDVKHIAVHAPYCDAFVMDKPMADLVNNPQVGLERRYGVRVFNLNNWDAFLDWLGNLDAEMSQEHRVGLATAYPRPRNLPEPPSADDQKNS